MDKGPEDPTGSRAGDVAPARELLAAVERAGRHLGVGGSARAPRPVIRFDAPDVKRRRLLVLGALAVLSLAGAALATLIPPSSQPADDVEADLRWAVAHVVRAVEAHRARTGSLPAPERLLPLLGEHLAYEASGDAYVVSGERDGVGVRFDGSVPLDAWLVSRRR